MNIREKNFINILINKIIEKNNDLIKNKNEQTPFYIIIDNADSKEYYNIVEKLINDENNKNENIYIYGCINIDSNFGKNLFLKLYNKKYTERGKLGFYVHYFLSKNSVKINKIEQNVNDFLNNLGNSINILKDFIQLIYYKEYINECLYLNNDFLMKYIKYLNLVIEEGDNNSLYISNIEFKSEGIKKNLLRIIKIF